MSRFERAPAQALHAFRSRLRDGDLERTRPRAQHAANLMRLSDILWN